MYMRKNIRLILCIIFFIPSYPIFMGTVAILGILPVLSCAAIVEYSFKLLGTTKGSDEEADAKWELGEAFEMLVAPVVMPFKLWYDYVKTGSFGM